MAGPPQEVANVNFSRYSSAVFEVAQQEVWRMFDWLHHHHYRHQPPAYVGQRLRESEGAMKRIGAKEKATLERQEDPATMDISLLYRLLQHTCGLRQDGPGFDWTCPSGEEQRQSLEHRLYLIKKMRNSLCHHPKQYMHLSDHTLDALLQELQGLLCHSLQQAGQRSGRSTGEVGNAVSSVRDRLAYIQASVPPSAITPQEFALLARTELQEQWEGLSSAGQRLSPPLLRWGVNAQVVTLDQLLQGPRREGEEPPWVLAVLGAAGIGKTSLCRQVVEAWLHGEAWLQGEAVEVVVVVELRQVFTRDLTRLLQEYLLPQTCRRCQPQEVLSLLGALRVLWLLDGFEEASADAQELLHLLVEWCCRSSGSHVVVVTCQPEYMEELNARLAPAATPCCVTHRGLTQQGFHSLLATLLQGDQEAAGEAMESRVEAGGGREEEAQGEDAQGRKEAAGEEASGVFKVKQEQSGRSSSREAGMEARCQAFLREVVALDPTLLGELHNPLKLALAVQLWKEGQLREVAGAPLTQLYAAIQEALVAKLVARLRTKSSLTEAEAMERLRRWVAALCGVALTMWGRGCFVALDDAAEQLLKDRAIDLLLPYTDCFSTFLTYRRGPGPRHGFLHHTQQSVLAAQHMQALLLQEHTSQEMVALLLPGHTTTTTVTSLDHFLGILVHAAASLATKRSLSEGRAKVLAELLQQCRQCPWLEVLHCTACCPALAREVRPRLPEKWEVTDHTVQAAAVLAAIQAPARITINLHGNLANLPHLILLLHCLAKAPVKVIFLTSFSFNLNQPPSPIDSLLLPLCDPASLCHLVSFGGMLTAEGCRALRRQQHNLVFLKVGVLEPAALEELVQLSHNTKHLMEMVILLYCIFKKLPSKFVLPRVRIHLCLVHVENQEAKAAVTLASRISHRFEKIILGRVSAPTVCRMVKAFGKEGICTPSLARIALIEINNIIVAQHIHCLPLPRPANMSLNDVFTWWNNFKLQVVIKVEAPPWVAGFGMDIGTAVGMQGGAGQ